MRFDLLTLKCWVLRLLYSLSLSFLFQYFFAVAIDLRVERLLVLLGHDYFCKFFIALLLIIDLIFKELLVGSGWLDHRFHKWFHFFQLLFFTAHQLSFFFRLLPLFCVKLLTFNHRGQLLALRVRGLVRVVHLSLKILVSKAILPFRGTFQSL